MEEVKVKCLTCGRIVEIPYEYTNNFELEICDAIAMCCEKPNYIFIIRSDE